MLHPDALRGARRLAAALLFASGFSAIAYQVLWVQQSGLWLGQESAAVVAVVAAFLGGLALGSLWVARAVESSRHPARWYAVCELAVAAWACVLVFSQEPVDAWLTAWTGVDASPFRQWSVSFGGTLLLLLPATVAMGATLPAMERCVRGLGQETAFSLLYAANTAGAMAGALGAAFWLVPQLGLVRTALCCGLVNLGCAVVALALPASASAAAAGPAPAAAAPSQAAPMPQAARSLKRLLALLLFATGLLGIGFELLVVRALSQVAENTVYTYALLLAVYLLGTSLGAAWHTRALARLGQEEGHQALLVTLGVVTATAVLLLGFATPLHQWLLERLPQGVGGALAAEALLAMAAFLPATFCMGLTFPQLVAEARSAGFSPGASLAANTLGGSLAPLFTLVLLPLSGLRAALWVVAGGYLLLAAVAGWRKARFVPSRLWWGGALAVALLVALSPPLQFARLPTGTQVLVQDEGRQATVSVLETDDGLRTLHIDNRQQEGGNRSTFADGRQALLPLLLHPAPRHALFLGVGTGVTSGVATLDPRVQVDAVELVPEVVEATRWFAEALPEEADLTRRRFIVADARRWVRAGSQPYDVVVADNFHPARSGTGVLYSREHFAAVKRRLAPGGVFCQWLPLHQLDLQSLASVVRSFQAVFPEAVAILATNSLDTPTIGLVGQREGELLAGSALERRLEELSPAVREAFELPNALAVAGTLVAGPEALSEFARDAVANTDDQPVVAYRAPFATYAAEMTPRERLLAVVDEWEPATSQREPSLAPGSPWSLRLAHYRAARNSYLHVGSQVRPVASLQGMLLQVRDPLLGVLRISPEFLPAFGPLWNMAKALAQQDPAAGEALLQELEGIATARDDLAGTASP